MRFLMLAEHRGLPRVATIQNAYNLVNRTFEQSLAEVALREDCGLLAYSPLGGGTLSGKYLNGARPAGARMTRFKRFTRYDRPRPLSTSLTLPCAGTAKLFRMCRNLCELPNECQENLKSGAA